MLEASKSEDLFTGMKGWYVLDPAFQRLDEMYGTEQAKDMYDRMNTLTGMASPGSDVMTEINRGTAANALFTQGKFDDFMQFGGLPKGDPRIPESYGKRKVARLPQNGSIPCYAKIFRHRRGAT
jgi:hypothetical protein